MNAVDYSGYPDCRPEFIESFERMANLATRAGVEDVTRLRIRAPLISMSKAEIIQRGGSLGVMDHLVINGRPAESFIQLVEQAPRHFHLAEVKS